MATAALVSSGRDWPLHAAVTLVLVLLLAGCTLRQDPTGELLFEPILAPMGIIFEYEISPDGGYAALLMPTEAAAPGSDAYGDIMRSGIWGKQQIFVYDIRTGVVINRSRATRDDVTNLRWADHDTLLFLQRAAAGSDTRIDLIGWNVKSDERMRRPFPHWGFDLSDDKRRLAAWGADVPFRGSNEVAVYTFPSLEKTASLLAFAGYPQHLDWAPDSSWLLVDIGPELWRLDVPSGDTEKLVDTAEVGVFSPLLDPSARFLVSGSPGVNVFDLQQRCVVLHLEARGARNSYGAPEWGGKMGSIYLVSQEYNAAQQTLLQVEIGAFLENGRAACRRDG